MSDEAPPNRWLLIRDLAVFQIKLAVDALRDFVLSPVALIAAVLDLLSGGERRRFYDVLVFGRRTERWINLFGEADRIDPEGELASGEGPVLDSVVGQVEQLIVDQYEKGGVTASAKDTIDRSLDRISRTPPKD